MGTPLRSVLCVKSNSNLREIEKKEDCFILDFNPCGDTVLNVNGGSDDADISVIAEKGKVACRDYPHARHLCVKNKFEKTPHESYCEQCYCFVCDMAAPCAVWTGDYGHCHAIDNEAWKATRRNMLDMVSRIKAALHYLSKKENLCVKNCCEKCYCFTCDVAVDSEARMSLRKRKVSGTEMGTKILISNLDSGVNNEDIKELFSKVGDLKGFSIHYDTSRRSKGTAEVVFYRRSHAEAAVKRYHNCQLDGKRMKIDIVEPTMATIMGQSSVYK